MKREDSLSEYLPTLNAHNQTMSPSSFPVMVGLEL